MAGVVAAVLGVYPIATARRIARHRSAFTQLMERVPTLVVGDLVVRPADPSDAEALIESMDHDFIESNGWTDELAAKFAARLRTTDPASLGHIAVADRHETVIGYGSVSGVSPTRHVARSDSR